MIPERTLPVLCETSLRSFPRTTMLLEKRGGAYEGLFPERWLPAAVAVLGEGFNEQNRMLNSTLKMGRGKITGSSIRIE